MNNAKYYLLTELFSLEIGHSAFERVIKMSACPLTEENLKRQERRGETHVHLIVDETVINPITDYPTSKMSTKIMSIEDAFKLLEEQKCQKST